MLGYSSHGKLIQQGPREKRRPAANLNSSHPSLWAGAGPPRRGSGSGQFGHLTAQVPPGEMCVGPGWGTTLGRMCPGASDVSVPTISQPHSSSSPQQPIFQTEAGMQKPFARRQSGQRAQRQGQGSAPKPQPTDRAWPREPAPCRGQWTTAPAPSLSSSRQGAASWPPRSSRAFTHLRSTEKNHQDLPLPGTC